MVKFSFGAGGILFALAIFIVQVNSIQRVAKKDEVFSIDCPDGGLQILKATWLSNRNNLKKIVTFNIRFLGRLVEPYIGIETSQEITKRLQENCGDLMCTFTPGRDLKVEYVCGAGQN